MVEVLQLLRILTLVVLLLSLPADSVRRAGTASAGRLASFHLSSAAWRLRRRMQFGSARSG